MERKPQLLKLHKKRSMNNEMSSSFVSTFAWQNTASQMLSNVSGLHNENLTFL